MKTEAEIELHKLEVENWDTLMDCDYGIEEPYEEVILTGEEF